MNEPVASGQPSVASQLHPDLQTLQTHVRKLQSLLHDPHPGLFTWNEFVADHWKAIVDLWYCEAAHK